MLERFMENGKFLGIFDRTDGYVIIGLFLLTCVFFWKVLLNPGKIIYPALDIIAGNDFWKHYIHDQFWASMARGGQ